MRGDININPSATFNGDFQCAATDTKQSIFCCSSSCFFSLLACSEEPEKNAAEQRWEDIVAEARGQTVDWFMWGGSPAVNAYVNGYVADQLKTQYDITLRQGPVQDIAEVVSKLVIEKTGR